MFLEHVPFHEIDEAHLKRLVENGIGESSTLEFKLELWRADEKGNKEFLKDASAFANSRGGYLLVGVKESDSIATEVTGIDTFGEREQLRLENLLQDGIEPRVLGTIIHPVRLESGKQVVLIRIPTSFNAPHRAKLGKSKRFYLRNSKGAYEASLEELRHMFLSSSSLIDRIHAFHKNRVAIATSGEISSRLRGKGKCILHVVPIALFSSPSFLDIAQLKRENKHRSFLPLADCSNERFNLDGYILEDSSGSGTGHLQIFRNATIEAVLSGFVEDGKINAKRFQNRFFSAFRDWIRGFEALNVPPPLAVLISFVGMNEAHYVIEPRGGSGFRTIRG